LSLHTVQRVFVLLRVFRRSVLQVGAASVWTKLSLNVDSVSFSETSEKSSYVELHLEKENRSEIL
jgi:hypothetical protein